MVNISEIASREINKVLQSDRAKGKRLFVSFMGYGWSGPVLGLALDEPNDSYNTYSSNAIDVQIHPDLEDQLKQFGGVEIDFVDNGPHQRGFTIRTKVKPDDSGCSSCGSGSDGCGE